MKITFNRQEVSNKIAPLMSVVSGKSTNIAAEGILIEANSPDSCNMTAFDLEKGMKITVECDVIEQGSYIINAQKFNQTLRVMDGEEITLTVDNKLGVLFECGKSFLCIATVAAYKYLCTTEVLGRFYRNNAYHRGNTRILKTANDFGNALLQFTVYSVYSKIHRFPLVAYALICSRTYASSSSSSFMSLNPPMQIPHS